MKKWTLMGFILGVCLVTLYAFPASADELTARCGLGYIQASVVSHDDWANDPPAALCAIKYDKPVSARWSVGVEGLHISNFLDGAPFNNNPDSSVDYYVGAFIQYTIWESK